MPLTPRLLFLAYDVDAYRVARGNRGATMILAKREDVEALNELQFIKAARNVYFSSWQQGPAFLIEAARVADRRQVHWSDVNVFIRRSAGPRGESYSSAKPEERATARHKLVSLSMNYPRPSRWLSALKVHPQPKRIVTGTAQAIYGLGNQMCSRRGPGNVFRR